MSLMTALYTGASGLEGNSLELSVVGDNIANANTIGFKSNRADFADAMAQSLIGQTPTGAGQRGLGSRLEMVQRIMTQGALTNTGLNTDLAISGNGFFEVKGSHEGSIGTFYTRAGQFSVDKDGFMVNMEGLRLQGYTADPTGALIPTTAGDLQVGNANTAPLPTTNVTVRANLQADDPVIPAAWDVANASTTSNFATATTAYDSLGNSHEVNLYYRKTGAGAWEWHAVVDGGSIDPANAGVPTEIGTGTLGFDTQGRLNAQAPGVINFTPAGADPMNLTFNFGTAIPPGTGLDGITQFASASATSFINQDGHAPGDLSRITVDPKGQIVGSFTNGETRVLGQVALASFEAPDQLMRIGGNLFSAMPAAGQPVVGAPSTADRGGIVAGALEQSNVDMAGEFVRMIAAQRAFQANAKTLTTADQLLQELMTIKR
jgi:flagellar hook protein FlgE